MTEQKITLELTLDELQLLDKYVEKTDDTYSVLMKIKDAYPSQKSPAEEAYKEIYGDYPMGEPFWIVFKKGYEAAEKSKVEPSLINCVLEGNPPNGYSYWDEWFEELESKGILHNLKISSKEFNEKVKEPTKPMDEVVERLVKKCEKEIETHKSQPKMTLENEGKFEIVSYNDKCYVRMDYSYDTLWYRSKNTKDLDGNNLILITDGETRRLLEGVWFNDVKRGKYD